MHPQSGAAVDSATEQMESIKVSDKAANGPTATKPPQESSRPPPTAPDEGREDGEDEVEDNTAGQEREAELQQLNEELAKEDPRCMILHLIILLS